MQQQDRPTGVALRDPVMPTTAGTTLRLPARGPERTIEAVPDDREHVQPGDPTLLVPARPTLRALLVLSASDGRKAFFAWLTPFSLEATAFSDCFTRTLCRSAMPIASCRPIFAPGAVLCAVVCAPAITGDATSAATRSMRLHLDADVYAFMGFT